jgi:hypothetical protein
MRVQPVYNPYTGRFWHIESHVDGKTIQLSRSDTKKLINKLQKALTKSKE